MLFPTFPSRHITQMTAELNREKILSIQIPKIDAKKNNFWPKSAHLRLFTIHLLPTWAIFNIHKSLKLLILLMPIMVIDYFYPQLSQV